MSALDMVSSVRRGNLRLRWPSWTDIEQNKENEKVQTRATMMTVRDDASARESNYVMPMTRSFVGSWMEMIPSGLNSIISCHYIYLAIHNE